MVNQPVLVLNRWQHPGDISELQKFTTSSVGSTRIGNSDGIYTDASFIRLKNVSLSYQLRSSLLNKLKISSCRLYMNAQNLFVITCYKGADPETQKFYVLPPMKVLVGGIQLNF
jgi:hypothetical protein